MRDFNNKKFQEILEIINFQDDVKLFVKMNDQDFLCLFYFFIKNFYFPVVIDDYPFEITDKNSLLEAMYYQIKLITMHDLNWDAMQEGLNDALNNFLEFKGLLLMFKSNEIMEKLQLEFQVLEKIIRITNENNNKKIKILVKKI